MARAVGSARELPDSVVRACAAELAAALGPDAVRTDVAAREAAARDYSWLSPVLRERLPATVPDLVVWPATRDDLVRAMAIGHRHRLPLTVRGRGTTNYGQAVPLARGLVVDTTRLSRVLAVQDGAISAEAGTSFVPLEEAARAHGQELAIFPTTVWSTLAGFIHGGTVGVGSIENGFMRDGFVRALDVIPYVDAPAPVRVEGAEVRHFVHTYGTTGVVASATVRLVPARDWTALFASFATLEEGAAAGRALMAQAPPPRLLAISDAALVPLFPPHPALRPGRVSLRAVVDATRRAAVEDAVRAAGGTVDALRADSVSYHVGLINNSTTLRVKSVRPDLFHALMGSPSLVERLPGIRAAFPDGMVQIEGSRFDGELGYAGRILAPYRDEASLQAGLERLRVLGVWFHNTHDWTVEGHTDQLWSVAARFDPNGLLNPGKLPPRPAE